MRSCREGYIYIIKADTGHYKIGKTRNVPQRMKLFAVKLPFDFEIINYFHCPDMHYAENILHSVLKEKRVRGEWFILSDEGVDALKSLGGLRIIQRNLNKVRPGVIAEFLDKSGQCRLSIESVKLES